MPTSDDAKIFKALADNLKTLATTLSLPVAYQNINFPSDDSTTPDEYLRASWVPNATRALTLGNETQQHVGIFQVSVLWPESTGLIAPLDIAGQIITAFDYGTRIFTVDGSLLIVINQKPYAGIPIQESSRIQIPVTIQYIV